MKNPASPGFYLPELPQNEGNFLQNDPREDLNEGMPEVFEGIFLS